MTVDLNASNVMTTLVMNANDMIVNNIEKIVNIGRNTEENIVEKPVTNGIIATTRDTVTTPGSYIVVRYIPFPNTAFDVTTIS
jgi:hypothetical protein